MKKCHSINENSCCFHNIFNNHEIVPVFVNDHNIWSSVCKTTYICIFKNITSKGIHSVTTMKKNFSILFKTLKIFTLSHLDKNIAHILKNILFVHKHFMLFTNHERPHVFFLNSSVVRYKKRRS